MYCGAWEAKWAACEGDHSTLTLRLRIYGALPLLPSLIFNGYQGTSPEVKWPGHEVNHSSPSSARVKNYWGYTSTPPLCLHGVERENLTFTFTSTFTFHASAPALTYLCSSHYVTVHVTHLFNQAHRSHISYLSQCTKDSSQSRNNGTVQCRTVSIASYL